MVNRIEKLGNEQFCKLAPLTAYQQNVRDGEELVARFFAYSDARFTRLRGSRF